MLFDLEEGSKGRDLIYGTGLKAQGAGQILLSLSDQRHLPLHYPLTLKIQGAGVKTGTFVEVGLGIVA